MNTLISTFLGWFGWGGALGMRKGKQVSAPSGSLVEGSTALTPDGALQLSTVWSCVWLLANVVATLPLFVFTSNNGKRDLARGTLLWQILHDSPNSRMTPVEFWVAMLLNLLLRGNAYARIERNGKGDAIALWPMPTDQVEMQMQPDGTIVYLYRIDADLAVLDASNVLHIKEIGNGVIGLARLDYMRASTTEAANGQTVASRLFANGGKPSGILMVDSVLKKEQRDAIRKNFIEMAEGGTSRLHVLEASMKYQQINLSPQDQQLLETRRFGVEEICRWFGVPPVLVGHSNVTAWGSGIEQLIDGFYKFTIRPALVRIEQAVTKRVLSPAQRATLTVEFNFDALLRASLKDRMEIYAKAVQNGLKTRNECRQLENDPPIKGADELTAQSNLVPLDKLGEVATQGKVPDQPQLSSISQLLLDSVETKNAEAAADRRHVEIMTAIKEAKPQPAPTINFKTGDTHVAAPAVHNHLPEPSVTVENNVKAIMPEQAAPQVDVKVEAIMPEQPAPQVDVKVEIPAVQKVEITSLPTRETSSNIQRDRDGNIIRTTQIEKDA